MRVASHDDGKVSCGCMCVYVVCVVLFVNVFYITMHENDYSKLPKIKLRCDKMLRASQMAVNEF